MDAPRIINIPFKEYVFGPNQTIRSVIHLLNSHSLSSLELDAMMDEYNLLNNNEVPRLGKTVKIPVRTPQYQKRTPRRRTITSVEPVGTKYFCHS